MARETALDAQFALAQAVPEEAVVVRDAASRVPSPASGRGPSIEAPASLPTGSEGVLTGPSAQAVGRQLPLAAGCAHEWQSSEQLDSQQTPSTQ
jgi:hypothetical protein